MSQHFEIETNGSVKVKDAEIMIDPRAFELRTISGGDAHEQADPIERRLARVEASLGIQAICVR